MIRVLENYPEDELHDLNLRETSDQNTVTSSGI